jgi:kynureninase
MISNSLGAMPRAVYDALRAYADVWATRGVRAWEERWWTLALEVGNELGALMNAPKDSVSLHQNVTTCQAVVASCFDFGGKQQAKRNKDRLQRHELSLRHVFLGSAAAVRRAGSHGQDG